MLDESSSKKHTFPVKDVSGMCVWVWGGGCGGGVCALGSKISISEKKFENPEFFARFNLEKTKFHNSGKRYLKAAQSVSGLGRKENSIPAEEELKIQREELEKFQKISRISGWVLIFTAPQDELFAEIEPESGKTGRWIFNPNA
jgi:hypothetical protein